MSQPRSRIRLSREDWIGAALQALADDGPSGVAVERLAARLGTTKGSFYWHFKDREELITEALATWEREDTDAVIEEMKEISDPVERRGRQARAPQAPRLPRPDLPRARLLTGRVPPPGPACVQPRPRLAPAAADRGART